LFDCKGNQSRKPGSESQRAFSLCARLWQSLSRRTPHQEWGENSYDAPLRTRFHYQWFWKRRRHKNKRPSLSIRRFVFLVTLFFVACRPPTQPFSPEAEITRVRAEFESGDLARAENDAKALATRVSALGDDSIWRVRVLYAEILVWRGNNDEAFTLLGDEVPASLGKRDYAARRLILRGLAEGHNHRYDESERDFTRAEQLASAPYPELIGDIFLARGSIQVDRGQYTQALQSYQLALQKAREFHRPFLEANAAGSLGYASTWLERYDESIDWYKSSLAISDSYGAHATSAKTLGNLGWSYHEIGDLQNALDQFQQAEKASQLAGLDLDRAYWLLSAGTVKFDLGDLRSAESSMLEALGLLEEFHDSSSTSECYGNLALVALQNGQFDLARQRLVLAEQANSPAPDFKRAQYDKLLGAELDFHENKFDAAAHTFAELLADKSVPTSLRWEAQATLAQVLAAQKKNILAERQFTAAISTISAARDAIRHEDFRLSFLSSSIRFYDEYVNFLLSQGRVVDALHVADRSRAQTLERGLAISSSASYRPLAEAAAFHPQEIARRQNATLLFYWLGPTHSFLWVVTPTKVSLLPVPARPEIDAAISAYRESFLDLRDPLESGNVYGRKLFDVLIRPAEKLIPHDSRVVILPDGSLTGLNFETLIAPDPQPHYWIEDATVSIADSLSLLARARNDSPPSSPNLLFFGDSISASKDFPPLADAAKESAALQIHFPKERSAWFTRERATVSSYLGSQPGRYSFVHFATHGTASLSRPLESAIILSPESDGSYKLYARQIMAQPLNAYLVSISACNGAGNRVLAGEGLVGLSWAFLRAGAHNVVAGLWEVSTASAPQVFDDLYRGVTAGQDPATALRQAKLKLVHSKGAYHRPFYWAPFQLYSGS
jgi:CHAT domain-containing protein